MNKMIADAGLKNQYRIDSAATTNEEIGNSIYPPARRELERHSIPVSGHRARRVTEEDMQKFDYVICMEQANIQELFWTVSRNFEKKVSLLLDFTDEKGDVADPWYTGDFEKAYSDIERGCRGLLLYLEEK